MRIVTFKKGRKKRRIFIPNRKERSALQHHLPALEQLCLELADWDVVHGFMPGRSAETNAYEHLYFPFSLSVDIENFFDSITAWHLEAIPDEINNDVLIEGCPRQGLCTSPVVSNIAMAKIDQEIKGRLSNELPGAVYTRYVDDLTVSFHDKETAPLVKEILVSSLARWGFRVNKRKTKFQADPHREITGIRLSGGDLLPTRKLKRKIRAAQHQKNAESEKGMKSWCKMVKF